MDLSRDTLLQTLGEASSQVHGEAQKSAESMLKSWEKIPGFFFWLQDIYLDDSLPLSVRWLSIILFKNGVDKYWRKSRVNAISKVEKDQIRTKVFNQLAEPNRQLMAQNAFAISRICRYDFPLEWPTLFDDLLSIINSITEEMNLIKIYNLLLSLNQIIKAIANTRIGRSRAFMQKSAPKLVEIIGNLYSTFVTKWMNNFDLALMEVGYLALKVTRRIIVDGYEYANRGPEAVSFFELTVSHLQALIEQHDQYSSDILERYVKAYGKLYYLLLNNQPTSFALMPSASTVLMTYLTVSESKAPNIINETEDHEFWEQVVIRGFLIVKRTVGFIQKKGAISLKSRDNKDKDEIRKGIEKLKAEVFKEDLIKHLADIIIQSYLRLRPSDLDSWQSEPEEWFQEEMKTSWEFQIRPCAGNLLSDIMLNYKSYLSDYILEYLKRVAGPTSSVDILSKDSIYTAFQLGSSAFFDTVDFDTLLPELFIPESLISNTPECKIVRWRVCNIISDWVSVKCSAPNRVEIYKLVLRYLDTSDPLNDTVVQLSAVMALRYTVDEWNFVLDDYLPFLGTHLELLFGLLNRVRLLDTKLFLLNVVAVITERVGVEIRPYANQLLKTLPDFWETSGDTHMIKLSIIHTIKNLCQSLANDSAVCHDLAINAIKVGCDKQSELYVLLAEDAFVLWQTVLKYAPEPTDDLLSLISLTGVCLEESSENIAMVIGIIKSYALLSPRSFISDYGEEVFKIFSNYLPKMRDYSVQSLSELVEILVVCCDLESVAQLFISSGFMEAMMTYVMDKDESPFNVVLFLNIFSRVSFGNADLFLQMVAHVSNNNPDTLSLLFDTWLDKFDNIGPPSSRKLNVLGLSSFLKVNNPLILSKLGSLLSIWGGVFEEINEVDGDAPIYHLNDFTEESSPSAEDIRRRDIFKTDIIHSVGFVKYCSECLNTAIENNGGQERFKEQYMSQINSVILEQIEIMMSKA